MRSIRNPGVIAAFLVVVAALGLGSSSLNAQKKSETIQANVWGQERATGRVFNMTVNIRSYSTPEDQKVLINAFQQGGQQQLVRALEKMKSKGQVAVTGSVGNPIAYVRSFPTETGRLVRILTQRPIRFFEAYSATRSGQYDVTIVEFNINDRDPNKSTGMLIAGARIKVDKSNQLVVESYGSGPWRMTGIKEWK